ncbi:MAG TPA: sigma-70 family RNA polymerase sigma factor [Solirubrobacterales bacterium]|jgi:RNA polymerase sigma factor (sigma-70 family)|nr:sigma-70 family RNA polymerase sigma factor [Solirubrobacterales bacterium]
MEVGAVRRGEVTEEQLREAQRGFTRLLFAKRFPRAWIEENSADLLAQAHAEFAERLVKGREDQTVGLLIVIAYRRAQALLDAQRRRPSTSSIDTVFHLADEQIPTPEEEVMEGERRARIAKAMRRLPEKDRKLLALVYFDGKSIREAGRELGWQKSAADRHHRAAAERLRLLLGDRNYLGDLRMPALFVFLRDVMASATQRLTDLWRRLSPIAEPSNAAAVSGGARAAVGVCGAGAALLCGLAASGSIGAGAGAHDLHPPSAKPREAPSLPAVSARRSAAGLPRLVVSPVAHGTSRSESPMLKVKAGEPVSPRAAGRPQVRTRPAGSGNAPAASTEQTVSEFGIESGSAPTQAPTPPASSDSSPPATAARPALPSSASGDSSSPSSTGESGSEFGM